MVLRLPPRLHLILIPKHIITVRQHLRQLVLEELRDKSSTQADHVHFVRLGGVLPEREGGGNADGEVVAADVEDIC